MWSNRKIALWKVFVIRLGVMLILLAISRWLLFIFNTGNFPNLSVGLFVFKQYLFPDPSYNNVTVSAFVDISCLS